MAPALGVLVLGLVAALAVVLLTGDDAEAPVSSSPVEEPTPSDAGDPPVDSEVLVPATTIAPTVGSTVPATTEAPEVVPPDEVELASPGFVRIFDNELPIVRACLSSPLPGFQITSYVYEDLGRNDVVEFLIDEGSVFGRVFDNPGDLTELGDGNFSVEAIEGDEVFDVLVNPTGIEVNAGCLGTSTATDPSNPDFPVTHSIVDVCFGDVPGFDENGDFDVSNGYSGVIAEGGRFTALPNADSSFNLDYFGPAGSFGAADPRAADLSTTSLVIESNLVGDPGGVFAGLERDVRLEVFDFDVPSCPPV
ncbi:MAG: hypothetical protein AB8G26_17680 [Ilumatobacter sp.]